MKNLDLLIPQPPEPRDEYRFGTVTSASPLMVRFDGDTASTPVQTALAKSTVGQRVLVLAKKQQRILLGPLGPDVDADTLRASQLLEGGLGLDRLYGGGLSSYHATSGYLVTTTIDASVSTLWTLDIRVHTYSGAATASTGWIWLQGYSCAPSNSMVHTSGTSLVGPRECRAFINSAGKLCFWVAPGKPYETAYFYLRDLAGSANGAISSISNAGLPSGRSRESIIPIRTVGHSGWQPVALAEGITGRCRINVEDRRVHLQGVVWRTGGWPAGLTTIGTTPTDARPTDTEALKALTQAAAKFELLCLADGTLRMHTSAATDPGQIVISGDYRND